MRPVLIATIADNKNLVSKLIQYRYGVVANRSFRTTNPGFITPLNKADDAEYDALKCSDILDKNDIRFRPRSNRASPTDRLRRKFILGGCDFPPLSIKPWISRNKKGA